MGMEKNHTNIPLFLAGSLLALTTLVHIFLGGPESYDPLRASALDAIPISTLSVVWHMVTVILGISAGALFYISRIENRDMAVLLLLINLSFAVLFIVYTLTDFATLFALPQWIAFLGAAALILLGLRK